MDQARADREIQEVYEQEIRKKMLPRLYNLFIQLDRNCNGELTLDEISAAPPEMHEEVRALVKLDDLHELFDIIGLDGSGVIEINEFFDSLGKIVSSKTPIDLIRLLKKVDKLSLYQKRMHEDLHQLGDI